MIDLASQETDQTTYSTRQVARMVGCSFRQLDYWVRAGWIPGLGSPGPGYGYPRRWTQEMVETARWLSRAASFGSSNGLSGVLDIPKLAEFIKRADAAGVKP